MKIDTNIQLTPHFKLSEFVGLPLPKQLPDHVFNNLLLLAQRLQVIRDIVGKPLIITSGYRSEQKNKNAGGASHSYHLDGSAVDFYVSGLPLLHVYKLLQNWSGGLGLYANHLHIDIRPYKARWSSKKP